MRLEQLILVYVRSLRDSKFSLYVAVLAKLAPWFFALDHTHYSRCVPIHIRDMMTLQGQHPDTAIQFSQGGFVVHKTKQPFSSIAIDQAHEQNNKVVKGNGGAVGLLQNQKVLLRWMVAGPQLARVIGEFEDNCLNGGTGKTTRTNLKHHEHTPSAQVKFATEIGALVQVLQDMGNPLLEESEDLLVLDSRDVADPAIVQTVREIEKTGQDQYEKYMTERVIERTTPVFDPISKNQMPLFSQPTSRGPSKTKQTITSLKSDCTLFSLLYIGTQTREGDLDNLFKHENHAYPPSLSLLGKLRFGTKSDLVECLEKLCTPCGEALVADVIILDGAAIINMLKPIGVKTFQDYATHIFLPFIKAQLRNETRIDIIWDVYLEDSLKSTAREIRGRGIRRRLAPSNTIPGDWQEFLRLVDNKTELFDFLVENLSGEKDVYTTCGQNVLCSRVRQDISSLAPCTHEEADTRMLPHAVDSASKRYLRTILRTVDTDVLVLAVSTVVSLQDTEIWVAFGTGKHLRYIRAHDIAKELEYKKALSLPMFNAFTGCDTVSSFASRGKKTAFDTWKSFNEVTPVFSTLLTEPSELNDDCMSVLEAFVVLLYGRTCTETTVDLARKHIFTIKGRSMDNLPPTRAALLQHTKRAVYQGGYVWGQALVRCPCILSPETYGWQKSATQGWQPFWTLLPEAVASCSELLKCGCKKGCRGLCKCVRAALKCTSLCHCSGNCDHNDSN